MVNVTLTGLTFTDSFRVFTGQTPVEVTFYALYPSSTTNLTFSGIPYNYKFYVVFENTVTGLRSTRKVTTQSANCVLGFCDATFTITQIAPPTPTPSVTPSITPTSDCTTYQITNNTRFNQRWGYAICSGMAFPDALLTPGKTVTVCAKTGTVSAGECDVIAVGSCINTSPTPTITPTVTPTSEPHFTATPTKSPTATATPSVTPSITPSLTPSTVVGCGEYSITFTVKGGTRNDDVFITYKDCEGVERTMHLYNTNTRNTCILETNGLPEVAWESTVPGGMVNITRTGNCYLT